MYCPKCNTCYMDDGKFCQECGAPLIHNEVHAEKKKFPLKILLAVAALSLSLVAGYSLYKKDGAVPSGKAPDAGLPASDARFTAGNSMGGGAVRHRVRHATHRGLGLADTAEPAAASSASGAYAPAPSAVPRDKASAGSAPKDVGTPRPAGTGYRVAGGGPASSCTAGGDSAAKKTAGGQMQMVVIRDPLSAESRN